MQSTGSPPKRVGITALAFEKRNCSVSCIIFPEVINPCLLFPGYQVDILCLLSVSVYFGSIVTGRPVNDAKGRWCPGGGMNVPVRIEITLPKRQANEIRRTLQSSGINAQILEI